MKIVDYIVARLSESSTWRGLALIIGASGIAIDPSKANAIAAAGMAVAGAINVFRKQSK
jgi:uncharacterized membrane protein